MDCTNARSLLNFLRPGEIDAAERDALEAHLAGCSDCATVAETDSRFDAALGKAMLQVPVPAGLKGRILHKLTERRAWRPWRWATAAALLLMAGGTALFFAVYDSRPELDPTVFVNVNFDTPELVETYFEGEGVAMVAPREFNFNQLESKEIALVKGRRVAKLTFLSQREKRAAVAHVYVLSAKEFKPPPDAAEFGPGTHTIEIRNRDGEFFFVVIYTSRSLEPFLLFQGV